MKREQCGCWNQNTGSQLDDQNHHRITFGSVPELSTREMLENVSVQRRYFPYISFTGEACNS